MQYSTKSSDLFYTVLKGLLSGKLTQLLDLCAEENSMICQHYMVWYALYCDQLTSLLFQALAATVLHHAVLKMITDLEYVRKIIFIFTVLR